MQKLVFCLFILCLYCQFAFSQTYHIADYSKVPFFKGKEVRAGCAAKNGSIWLATTSGLVNYFGGNSGISYNTPNSQALWALELKEAKDGTVWVAAINGIYYTQDSKLLEYKVPDSLKPANGFTSVSEDSNGNLWFCGNTSLLKISNDKKRTLSIVKTNDRKVYDVFEIASGEYWIGTSKGICTIQNGALQSKIQNPGLSEVYHIFRWLNNDIYFIGEDLNIVNRNDGTYKKVLKLGVIPHIMPLYCIDKNRFVAVTNLDSIKIFEGYKIEKSFSARAAGKLWWTNPFIDKDGNIWAGQNDGLSRVTNYPVFNFLGLTKQLLPESKISFIRTFGDTLIVAGTDKYQFFSLNVKTRAVVNLQLDKNIGLVFNDAIKKGAYPLDIFFYEKSKAIVFNGYYGIFLIDTLTRKVYKFEDVANSNANLYMYLEDKDSLWIGGSHIGSLNKHTPNSSMSLSQNNFQGALIYAINKINDSDSIILGGTNGLNIYYKGKVSKLNSGLWANDAAVFSIADESKDSKLLFVDGFGLYRLKYNGQFRFEPVLNEMNLKTNYNLFSGFVDSIRRVFVKLENFPFYQQLMQANGKYYFKVPRINEWAANNFSINTSPISFGRKYFFWAFKDQLYGVNFTDENFFRPIQPISIINIEVKNNLGEIKNVVPSTFNLVLPAQNNTVEFTFSQIDLNNTEEVTYQYYLEGTHEKVFSNESLLNTALYRKLPPGEYTFYVKAKNNVDAQGNWIVATFSFKILPPWYRTWWAYLLWASLTIYALYLFYKWRLTVYNKKLALEKIAVESELKALRAQLNPHFVQNTFDLIARQMQTGEKNQSLASIHNISSYLRQVLNKSELATVSLEDEIEYTKQYLKIQQLIKPGLFTYGIKIGNNVDVYGIQLPTMLLQPIVENCIKHGFKKIERGGHIDISISQDKTILKIEISDNGIGLSKDYVNENSKGIQFTKRRLGLLFPDANATNITVTNNTDNIGVMFKMVIDLKNFYK